MKQREKITPNHICFSLPSAQKDVSLPSAEKDVSLPSAEKDVSLPLSSKRCFSPPQLKKMFLYPQLKKMFLYPQLKKMFLYPQLKKMFLSKLVFLDLPDLVFTSLLIYNFRIFERRFGSRKFVVCIVTSILTVYYFWAIPVYYKVAYCH